ncbi:hypothetical protein X993_5889 [Burkholderia pseudomallei K42]|nr:hypothetical protein X993_5889 [Burkholderia pseudomallei K42]
MVRGRGGDAVWRRSMCAARSGRRRGLADSGARATAMGAMGRNGRDERNGLQWVAMGAPSMRRIRRRHFGGPRQGGAPTFPRPPAIGCFLARAAIASGSCERRQARTRRRPLRRTLRLSRLRDAGARTARAARSRRGPPVRRPGAAPRAMRSAVCHIPAAAPTVVVPGPFAGVRHIDSTTEDERHETSRDPDRHARDRARAGARRFDARAPRRAQCVPPSVIFRPLRRL